MCLGIPGQVVELDENPHLAMVDVAGVRRSVNIGLLESTGLAKGDYVLIHVGFAMAQIDEAEAARALEGLKMLGDLYDQELDDLSGSQIQLRYDGNGG